MKIRLTCNWCSDEDLVNRFNRVYISSLNKDKNYEFTSKENFDFLVIINYSRQQIAFDREKTLGVIMEPSWSPHYKLRHLLEPYCKHILYHKPLDNSQYIYYPGLLPYHFDYNTGEDLNFYTTSTFKKTKKCSMVVSNNSNSTHKDCLYKQRVDFVLKVLDTDLNVDIYGNNWEHSNISDSRIKGTIDNKATALLDYVYSISIENCSEPDYFSEKLTDCILTNTTPIYYGCPNVKRFFPNTSIIQLSDLEDNGIKQLKQVLSISEKTFNYTFEKELISTKYNLYIAIKKYIKSQNITEL